MDTIKNLFSSQPEDYDLPNWYQKLETKWDGLTSTQRKVAKVAIPVFVIIVAVGAGFLVSQVMPEGWGTVVGPGVMMVIGGLSLTGYQLAKKKWGESYAVHMAKLEEGKITEKKKKCFKDNKDYFRDFNANELAKETTGELFQKDIHYLLTQCHKARAINLGRHFDSDTLQIVATLPKVKRLTLDFSQAPSELARRGNKERIQLIAKLSDRPQDFTFYPIKHITLTMPPDKPAEAVAGENLPHDIEFSAEFVETLVKACPGLKTVQISHLHNAGWVKFLDLKKLREVSIETKTLQSMTEVQAKDLSEKKWTVWSDSPKFKHFKVTHDRWNPDPKVEKYTKIDDFKPEVKSLLENSQNGNFYLNDEEGADDKNILTMEYGIVKCSEILKKARLVFWRIIKKSPNPVTTGLVA